MRRLFSSFARGWPGVGLLLIRLVAGFSLIIGGVQVLQTGQTSQPVILGLLAIADGALLVAGLWTPVAGALVVAVAVWKILLAHSNAYPDILLAAMGVAAALVGPGSLSVDAWLFGWKKIEFEN